MAEVETNTHNRLRKRALDAIRSYLIGEGHQSINVERSGKNWVLHIPGWNNSVYSNFLGNLKERGLKGLWQRANRIPELRTAIFIIPTGAKNAEDCYVIVDLPTFAQLTTPIKGNP